jgi:hypothetical protein
MICYAGDNNPYFCSMTKYNWAPWDRLNSNDRSFYVVNTQKRWLNPFNETTNHIDGSYNFTYEGDYANATNLNSASNTHFIIVPIHPPWEDAQALDNNYGYYDIAKFYGTPIDTYETVTYPSTPL